MFLLYIDPGTGSMLFTVLLGLVTTGFFFVQKLWIRFKFYLSAGKAQNAASDKASYIIFSDNKNYWPVFRPICDEFERRKIPVNYWTASENDPALNTAYEYIKCEFIGEGNRAFSRLNTMNAVICLATTPGLDVLQWKRSKNVNYYIHILHAAGTAAGGYRMFSLDYYDAVLLTGEYQIQEIRELEQKRNLPQKEVLVVGCTYMDELKRRLDSTDPSPNHPFTVLLAPSWGQSSLLVKYGQKILDELIATGYNIIIRPHPQSFRSDKDVMDRLLAQYPETEQLHWDQDGDNFNSLNSADIMISDFSSVMFDYTLVFNKPVIYAESVFDKAPYEAMWLDEELWKFRILPSIGMPLREEDFGHLKEVIRQTASSQALSEGISGARAEAWMHIGESAKLTADYMIRKHKQLTDNQ